MQVPERAICVKRQPGGRLRIAAVMALIAGLCQAPFISYPRALASSRTSRAELVRRQRQLETEKARARQLLRRIKPKQRAAGYELKEVEQDLRVARAELIHTTAQLHAARHELVHTTRRLNAARSRLDRHREALADRLVAFYELGIAAYIEVLARAVSFADFANRLYLVQLIVDQDLGLMRAMETERRRIEAYCEQVQEKERRIRRLETQVAIKHEEYVNRREQKARQLTALTRQRAYWERALAQMEQDSRDIAAQIRRYQHTAGRLRYSRPWTGSFLQPVSGTMTSGFGFRIHPILGVRRMHTGVDIAAPTGIPIRAADVGTVIWSAARGGYGLCVVIDHGGGMSTVYGHCSRLAVNVGEEVRKGEVIAYVGSTGLSTGPHLHFEVRRNGNPVDPLRY